MGERFECQRSYRYPTGARPVRSFLSFLPSITFDPVHQRSLSVRHGSLVNRVSRQLHPQPQQYDHRLCCAPASSAPRVRQTSRQLQQYHNSVEQFASIYRVYTNDRYQNPETIEFSTCDTSSCDVNVTLCFSTSAQHPVCESPIAVNPRSDKAASCRVSPNATYPSAQHRRVAPLVSSQDLSAVRLH